MQIVLNFDLLSLGIAIAATGILGFIVLFNNRNSATNKSFLFFSLLTIIWSTFNYANYQVQAPTLVLWLLRIAMFFAVWHAFSLFQLFYVFPKEIFAACRKINPSPRGELEITDAIKMLIDEGKEFKFVKSDHIIDVGTHEQLVEAEELVRKLGL